MSDHKNRRIPANGEIRPHPDTVNTTEGAELTHISGAVAPTAAAAQHGVESSHFFPGSSEGAFQAAIFSTVSVPIIAVDLNGTITSFNAAAEKKLGYNARDVVGKATPALFHNHAEMTRRAESLSAELGQPIEPGVDVFVAKARRFNVIDEHEWTYTCKDRTRFPALVSVTALHDGQGALSGYVASIIDLSARKQADEEIRKRATELELVAAVSAAATTQFDVDELLQIVADRTKASFELYHAHVYLLDETETRLDLAAGAGDAGRTMRANGHNISLDREHSLVARAARTRQGVIVNDVRTEPDFLPNPLLPDTRAEMAVPMVVGDTLVGVLDVQSAQIGRFGPDDVRIKTVLADQIAVAVQNARSFTTTQRLLNYNRTLLSGISDGFIVSSTVDGKIHEYNRHAPRMLGYADDELRNVNLLSLTPPEWQAATHDNIERMLKDGSAPPLEKEFLKKDGSRIPVRVAPALIQLADGSRRLITLITDLTASRAAGVERERLLAQAEDRLKNVQASSRVAELIQQAGDVEHMREEILQVLIETFKADNAVLSHFDNSNQTWYGQVGFGGGMSSALAKTFIDPAPRYPHGVEALETARVVAIDDAHQYPNFPKDYLEKIGIKSVMVLPLSGNPDSAQATDVIFLNYNAAWHLFTPEEIDLAGGLANQLSVSIQRRTAEDRLVSARAESELLYRLGEAINAAQTADELVQAAQIANVPADDVTLTIFENYDRTTATFFEIAAAQGKKPQPVGSRFLVQYFPTDQGRPGAHIVESLDNRAQVDEITAASLRRLGYEAYIAIQLNQGDRNLGSLTLTSATPMQYTTRDQRVLEGLGGLMSAALERIRLREATEAARAESELLYRLGEAINAAQTTDELMQAAQTADLGADLVSLTVFENYDLATATFFETIPFQEKGTRPTGRRFPIQNFPDAQRGAGLRIVESLDNRAQVDEVTAANIRQLGYAAYIAISLIQGERILGSLTFFSRAARPYTPQQRRIVEGLGDLMSAAFERTRLRAEMETAREEADLLYRLSSVISTAETEQQLVDGIVEHWLPDGANSVSILLWENRDFDTAQTLRVAADLRMDDMPATRGLVLRVDDFPLTTQLDRHHVYFSNDVAHDPTIDPVSAAAITAGGTYAYVAAPLTIGTRWLGMLSISSHAPRNHSEQEVRILRALTRQLTTAVERLQLIQQTQMRATNLETVAQVSAATATILNVDDLLQTVSDLARERFNLYHAHVYLLDNAGEWLTLAAGAGDAGMAMKQRSHRIALDNPASLVARAGRSRAGVIVNDVTQAVDFLPNPLLPDTRAELAVPMVVAGQLVGVFDVQSEQTGRFGPEDVRIQTTLADQIAVAVQNARLYQNEVKTAQQLREIDRLKSEFLASMSHELRTPLNSIIGYSEVLADGIDGDLPEEALEDVNAIHDSGQHLLSLINDVLDLAKIEAGHMELDREQIGLHDVLIEIQRLTSVLIKDKPVQLHFDVPVDLPILDADHVRLRQILNNLVTNAIKFTDKGEIVVSAALLENGRHVQINVKDSGIGIAPENQKVVFEQFRQVDGGSTRRVGGTGLGLPITQRLVQMHGGDIWLNSMLGAGSTFSFTIPVATLAVTD